MAFMHFSWKQRAERIDWCVELAKKMLEDKPRIREEDFLLQVSSTLMCKRQRAREYLWVIAGQGRLIQKGGYLSLPPEAKK